MPILANASTTDDGFVIILSPSSRFTEIKDRSLNCSRLGHGCPKMTLDSAHRGKTSFRRGRSYGHSQSQFEQNQYRRYGKVQCIVDSCLYISIVESGFWNMFLAMIICECSSSLFTFNSDWYFSARLFSNSSEKRLRLCGLKAQSAFSTAPLSVKRCFISPVTVSIISKYLDPNCVHISRLFEIIIGL